MIKEDNDSISIHSDRVGQASKDTPPFTAEQVHSLIHGNRHSQFQYRRRADRHLLAVCIVLLFFAVCLLRQSLPYGLTIYNAAILSLSVLTLWIASRAAYSLWLMRQTLRFRFRPHRMRRYSLRLDRLSHRRRRWLELVLRSYYSSTNNGSRQPFKIAIRRAPSYAVALICIAILAGASTWLLLNRRQPNDDQLYAHNKVPDVTNHTTLFDEDTIPPALPGPHTSPIKKATPKNKPVSSTAGHRPHATESTHENTTQPIDSEKVEESLYETLNNMARGSKITVTCNSGSCSAERYCAMLYEDILRI